MNVDATAKVANRTASEYGYGLYINGYVSDDDNPGAAEGIIWAWECLPSRSTDNEISAASRRVCRNAIRSYKTARDNR